MGWQGATFHTNLYQIHGTGLSRYYVNNFITVSAIEALPASRLFELWVEQKFFDGQLSLKVGQIPADTEFAVSQTGTLFVNSTFGWPNIIADVLPSGGPIYPLAVPAVRGEVRAEPELLAAGRALRRRSGGAARADNDPDPQRRNRTGTNFRTNDPALVIAEAAYAYNIAKGDPGEPGTVTLGGWHHFGRFDSLRFDTCRRALGRSRRPPASRGASGATAASTGSSTRPIYREPDDPNDGASVFVRLSGSPADRNIVDVYLDAGIAYKGLFQGRSDDTVGLAFALSRISRSARGFDLDSILADRCRPARGAAARR